MFVVDHVIKIDVLKIEQAFQTKYHKGDKVLYVYPINWKGVEEIIDSYVDSWNAHWHSKNEKFENILLGDSDLKFLSRHNLFCVGWQP